MKKCNKFVEKYEELKELIDPYNKDWEYFGEPNLDWLDAVKNKFIEMDEMLNVD